MTKTVFKSNSTTAIKPEDDNLKTNTIETIQKKLNVVDKLKMMIKEVEETKCKSKVAKNQKVQTLKVALILAQKDQRDGEGTGCSQSLQTFIRNAISAGEMKKLHHRLENRKNKNSKYIGLKSACILLVRLCEEANTSDKNDQ